MSYERRFNRLDVGFWTRQRAALSAEAKLITAYLRTCAHTRAGGLMRLPVPYAARDLGLPEAAATKALAELAAAGDIAHDPEAELVAVLDWPLHDRLDNAGAGLRAARNVLGEHRLAPASEAVQAALAVLLPELGRVLTATRGGREREALVQLLPEVEQAASRPSPDRPQTVSGPSADPWLEASGTVGGSPESQPCLSNNARSPAPAGSPRAPGARGRRTRRPKAADQPALLAPEPAQARQVDPDRLPMDNPDLHPGRLARLLAELILARDPKARVPDPARKRDEPGLYKWACEIDKLRRIDGRDWAEIERIIRWCQADGFWRGNILSAGKLRKQFDTLLAQADRGKPAPRPAKPLPALHEAVRNA